MRKIILAATALTAVASTSMAVDVKLYGLVDKSLMYSNDGRSDEFSVVDNNLESTRIGFGGEQKLDNGLTAGVLFEVEQQSNASNAITQNTTAGLSRTPAGISNSFTERMARVSLGGAFGTVLLGQQDVATDDAPYHDLAAAGSVMNANVAAFGGALNFTRQSGANLTAGGIAATPGTMALGQDGALDAADAIRYNTPSYMGFNGSASVAQGGNVDVTGRYAGDVLGLTVDSALGYKFINNNTTATNNQTTGALLGSVSVKHKSGVGATLAYQGRSIEHKAAGVDDGQGIYGKVGYNWDAFGVAVDYGHFSNPLVTAVDNEMDVFGLGADYDLGHGVTVGAAYRNYNAKVAGVGNDDQIDVAIANMKVKF